MWYVFENGNELFRNADLSTCLNWIFRNHPEETKLAMYQSGPNFVVKIKETWFTVTC